MSKSFDPYYQWLGIPPHEQPPDYYRLLGLAPFEGNPDVIESAADRQMAHVRTHQSGKYGEQSQKLLNEIAAAKLCLLSPEKKAAYNAHLKAGDNSASQEKPIKRADPIPGTPATNRRDAAPAPKQAPQASDRGGTLAPLVVVLAGGAAMLVLLLGIAGAAMWFMIDNSPAPPAVAANTGPTAPPVVEEEFDPPISPPPVKGETDSPLAETDDGVKPSPPRFPGPSGPAPVVLNPNGTPDDSTTEPVAVVNDTSEPREAADEQKQDEDEPALASFFPPENEDTRQPIPDEAERNQRRNQIEELFEVSKAVRLEDKLAIAGELAKTGRETKSDFAARYALFSMSQEVASEAGDIRQALAAAKELDSQFQVDGVSLRLDSHIAAADAAVPAAQRKVIVTEGIKFVDQLFEHDRYIDAAKLIKQLQTVARKNRDADQLARLSAQQQTGSALYRAFKDASDAIERLKTDPADAESAAAAGKYVALAKGDWQLGLPMLAAGDDEALKQLAEREIAGPKTTDERRQLAKDWQESAKGYQGVQADHQLARAAMWYGRVVGSLNGLAKFEVQKEIDAIGKLNADGGAPYRAPVQVAVRPEVSDPVRPIRNDSPAENTGKPVDLLAKVDLSQNIVKGNWTKQPDHSLSVGAESLARLQIPVTPPEEYVVEADVTRTSGQGDLTIGLIYHGIPCSIAIDGFGGTASCITGSIRGRNIHFNRKPQSYLTNNERSTIKCTVTDDGILVECDGNEVLHYRGRPRWDSWNTGWSFPNKTQLSLGTNSSHYRIHSMTLTPAAGAALPAGGAVDLMALIDVKEHAVLGEWRQVRGELLTPQINDAARLVIPYHPPEEYDLEVELTRRGLGNDVAIGLVYQGKQCHVALDRYRRTSSDLQVAYPNDGQAIKLKKRVANVLPTNQRMKVTCAVRKDHLQVHVNDEELFTFRGDADWEGLDERWTIPDKQALMIGTWWTLFQIHSIKLTPVGDDAGAPAPASPVAEGAVDLLKLIDLDEHIVAGEWEFRNEVLFTARDEHGRVAIPFEPPQSYQIEIDAVQRLGTGPLIVGLVMDGKQFAVSVGQKSAELYSLNRQTLGGVQGREFLKLGQPAKIICIVKPGQVKITCDDQTVLIAGASAERLQLPDAWKVPSDKTLFIGSSRCLFHVSSMKLTPLDE